MASQNIARLGVVLGLDTAEFTASIDKAISENAKLKNAIRKDTNAAAAEVLNLVHATEDYGKTLTRVQMIERETTSGRFMNATKEMKQMLLDKAAAYDKVANATSKATAAQFKMNEQQKLQLTYQTTDLFTQIASGQSPFIALIQQGGQLKDSMGGVKNMFTAIGSLFTPMRLAIGGVVGAMGALGYAAYSGRDEFDKLRDTLALTGNYAGITTENFYQLSNELSNRTNLSIGKTKDALNAVLASGKFTAESISSVTQAVIQYSQIAGVDAKTAAEKLMAGLDGSASGAKALNKEMNFLTLQQYKQIEALEQAGKKQEAAKLAADALNTQLAAQRRELGTIEKAWESATNALSGFWNLLKDIGKPETTEQVINNLDKQIKVVQDALNKNVGDSPFEKEQRKQLQLMREQREALLETERLKARSLSSKDVGDSKAKIEDYAAAGGIAKEKQIIAATEKAKADIKYTQSLASLNEIERIEAEAAKQIAEKKAEFNAKSEQEKRAMGGLLARQLAAEQLDIEVKKNEKIRLIRQKEKIDTAKAQIDEQKQIEEMNNQYAQMKAVTQQAALDKTYGLELDKEDLQLRQQMLYTTEKEQKLEEIRLKYRRLQVTANNDPVLQENLRKQQELEEFNIVLQDSIKKSGEVFNSVFGNMSSAIDNFVRTGKLSFRSLAVSIIQDLIAIQMKAATMQFLNAAFSMFTGGGMGPQQGSMPLGSSFNQYLVPKAAAGGTITGPTIVGEKGPELFMPSGSGTIIPNSQMAQMGGVTNVTNNYINAIDTKSFEDRLLNSSNAIWAANQYAGKNMPTNFGRT